MRYNIPATLSFLERILIWALVTFCSTTWLKSPVVNLASARENAASFITSPIRVFVWWEIINISKLQVTKLAQSSWTASKKTLLLFDSNFVVDFMSNFFGMPIINDWYYIQVLMWTYLDDFSQNHTESHLQGISLFLEKSMALYCSSQTAFYQHLSTETPRYIITEIKENTQSFLSCFDSLHFYTIIN